MLRKLPARARNPHRFELSRIYFDSFFGTIRALNPSVALVPRMGDVRRLPGAASACHESLRTKLRCADRSAALRSRRGSAALDRRVRAPDSGRAAPHGASKSGGDSQSPLTGTGCFRNIPTYESSCFPQGGRGVDFPLRPSFGAHILALPGSATVQFLNAAEATITTSVYAIGE